MGSGGYGETGTSSKPLSTPSATTTSQANTQTPMTAPSQSPPTQQGGNKTTNAQQPINTLLTNTPNEGTINTERSNTRTDKLPFVSGALNSSEPRALEHAERYYELVRSMSTDCSKIAQSWQRLQLNPDSILPHDLVLLKHEKLEHHYMSLGMTQSAAHDKANEEYNYEQALLERE